MKKRSKWTADTHGAYCKCNACSSQDFNIHKDLDLESESYEFRGQIQSEQKGDDELYIDNIEKYFGG